MSYLYYCYGPVAEYSLDPLELALRDAGRDVVCAKDWTTKDFMAHFSATSNVDRILLSSAHPGINSLTGKKNIPIADLRRIHPWKKVAFFPHDLSEPFRWEERCYLNDYDFFVSEFDFPFWISRYLPIIKLSGLKRFKQLVNLGQDFLFLPDEFDSYGLEGPVNFITRFPFVLANNVVTKLGNAPGASELSESLRENYGIKILSPKILGFEIISPANGVLMTQGPSGVLTEALVSNMDAIFVYESPLSDWMKQDLVNRFPAIVDFYSAQDGELVRPTRVGDPAETSFKALDISDLLVVCEG